MDTFDRCGTFKDRVADGQQVAWPHKPLEGPGFALFLDSPRRTERYALGLIILLLSRSVLINLPDGGDIEEGQCLSCIPGEVRCVVVVMVSSEARVWRKRARAKADEGRRNRAKQNKRVEIAG